MALLVKMYTTAALEYSQMKLICLMFYQVHMFNSNLSVEKLITLSIVLIILGKICFYTFTVFYSCTQ